MIQGNSMFAKRFCWNSNLVKINWIFICCHDQGIKQWKKINVINCETPFLSCVLLWGSHLPEDWNNYHSFLFLHGSVCYVNWNNEKNSYNIFFWSFTCQSLLFTYGYSEPKLGVYCCDVLSPQSLLFLCVYSEPMLGV